MSSSTATPSTSRAKRVWRIFRSKKMREITGMEVTATAMLITSSSAVRLAFTPMNQLSGSNNASASMMKKGSTVPMVASHAICLRSCF